MIKEIHKKTTELSFTIFETVVAVTLLLTFSLEYAGGQGNVVNKVEYARRSNEAIWLAKRIMSQVEYNYQTLELKELDLANPLRDQKFKGVEEIDGFDYTYNVDVKEWKFPLFDLLLNGGVKSTGEDGEEEEKPPEDPAKGAAMAGLEGIVKQIFQGHILKIAHVEVTWPDGARRDSVSLTYLLTNQRALDEFLLTKKAVYDNVIKKMMGTPPPPKGDCSQDPPNTVLRPDGVCQWPDGTQRFPDGSKILADGTRVPAPEKTPTPPGVSAGGGPAP